MAIFGSLFAVLGRFAGRLLNSALGWATILLFGKVEGRRQTVLLVMALGSLAWLITLAGIIWPRVATFVLAFVPIPGFVDDTWIRLAMLAMAALIPLLIGVGAIVIESAERRPKGRALVGAVFRGYPFTFVLAVTIVFLGGVSLVRKAMSLARRWQDAHVPVIVKPGGYERVVADLESVLDEAGLDVRREPAPRALSLPPRLLDAVAGKALGALVPDRLITLKGAGLDVLVYPSDIAIAGTKDRLARARGAIAAKLIESPAYLTASAESERIEDRLTALTRADAAKVEAELARIDEEIARLTVPFEEWETVYRHRLQVERNMLARLVQKSGGPAVTEAVTKASPDAEPSRRAGVAGWAIGLVSAALLALDVALLLLRGRRPRRD
jgi:hypothetical protein